MTNFTSVGFDPFAAPAIQRTAPSTESQRELWTASQLGSDASLAFNEAVFLELTGNLDVEAFRKAFLHVVGSHEALQSALSADGLTILVEPAPTEFTVEDLSELNVTIQNERVLTIRSELVHHPFDLSRAPLYRARLLRLAPDSHQFYFVAHHIVCDGWSMSVVLGDLAQSYRTLVESGSLPRLDRPRFTGYAQAEREQARSESARAAERYWLTQFASPVAALELPLDRPRPPSKTYTSDRLDIPLDAGLVEQLKSYGASCGASLFSTMLAGFAVLMRRLAASDDLVIGIPAAGQSQCGESTLVGHCVNMLPWRTQPTAPIRFADYLKQVQTSVLDAYEHQNLTFGHLLQKLALPRDPSRLPLMSVSFNVDQAISAETLQFGGIRAEFGSVPRAFENFEIFVNAVRGARSMVLEVQYNTDLYDRETIERWFANFEVLLRSIVADPTRRLDELELLTLAETTQFAAWNAATARDYPRTSPLGELLLERAQAAGSREALVARDCTLDYGELARRALGMTALLQKRGVGPGCLVGVSLSRTSRLLVAVLGVLRSGAAYVPLDPTFPKERLSFMLQDSGLSLVLTESSLEAELPSSSVPTLVFDESQLGAAVAEVEPERALPEHPAYVIYTSGSTGKPKGVVIPRRAVANFLDSMAVEPGLTAHDRLLAVTTLSFDISVLELLLPIWTSATTILATSSQAADATALAGLLHEQRATVMQATPATWRLLLGVRAEGLRGLKALCGGEALSASLAAELHQSGVELWNMYGPTETTVWSTCQRIQPGSKIGIGRPIGNTQIYVVDGNLQRVPLGVVGELCIGGDGVTLGYLNRPDLTERVFVDNPFGHGKLYRTGDLARMSRDGMLECLGRSDGQVKVRGYRIELGEIDSVLGRHESVRQCVTIVREDRPGDHRLVSYVVPKGKFPESTIYREFLRASLPDYMVPQHFVEMAAFPLTPNGKVDRKRLPIPFSVMPNTERFEEPRTPSERVVQRVWQNVLGLPRIGALDNFFNLGGHSLLAAQVVAAITRETGVELSMRRVFDTPTLRALASALDAASSTPSAEHQAIPRRERNAPARLSPMQQRAWFMEEMNPGTIIFNLSAAYLLHGALNRAAFHRALNEIVRRHTALRTTIRWHEGELLQFVAPELELDLECIDLRSLPPDEREAEFRNCLARDGAIPFDLSSGPLVRVKLYQLGDSEHALSLCRHHAIWDGWSVDIFCNELDRLYSAFCKGEVPNMPELPVTYGDYAEWFGTLTSQPEFSQHRDYWKKQLGGELPILELPTEGPRPANMSFKGAGSKYALDLELTDQLSELAQRHGATLFMALLTAYEILLHKVTGQHDIVVGTPMRGRNRPELEGIIGYFVNPLPLRVNVEDSATVAELLQRTKAVCVEAFEHQDLPFDMLVNELNVERDTSRTPIYSAFYSYQDARNRRSNYGDLSYDITTTETPVCPTDLSLWAKRLECGVIGELEYAADLFSRQTAKQWVDEYLLIVRTMVARPELTIGQLAIHTEADLARLSALSNNTVSIPQDACLPDLIEAQVERTPEAIAVRFGRDALSYAELNQRANRLATALLQQGVRAGTKIGICLERCADLLVAALAVQKCGAAYVPLDPAFPIDRLRFMVEDSGLEWVIVHEATRQDAPLTGKTRAFDLDLQASALLAISGKNPERGHLDPGTTPAYVIYTSGSTGKPKGVVIPQSALVNFVLSMRERPGISAHDRLLAVTTLSFDIAVLELYVPLLVGAQVVIASRETTLDGDLLDEAIEEFDITIMQATPSTWRLLLAAGFAGKASFKVLCGGEALPLDLARQLLQVSSEAWNMYGPTETTVWSTCCKLEAPLSSVRIGTPIANTSVYVVDSAGRLVPWGSPGELWIGGNGVALGYHERPELTADRFIDNPFGEGRLYKTGDLVRLRYPGEIEYLRRNDNQVKLRGYRIELGEIESALNRLPSIRQAVVILREDDPGDVRLVAYIVYATADSVPDAEIRAALRETIPEYMVPQCFVALEHFPLTPNGKVDRKVLPRPEATASTPLVNYLAPRTEEEILVANIWVDILRVRQVGLRDNFFDIGGHSLLCLQLTNRLEQATGIRLNPRVILRNDLEQVAALIARGKQAESGGDDEGVGAPTQGMTGSNVMSLAKRIFGRITGR